MPVLSEISGGFWRRPLRSVSASSSSLTISTKLGTRVRRSVSFAVILALLACMDAFRHDLQRDGSGVPVSLSLFIRNDIYTSVAALAREPDKLPVRRMTWGDEIRS